MPETIDKFKNVIIDNTVKLLAVALRKGRDGSLSG